MANRAALIRTENAGRAVTRRGRNFIEFDLGGGQRRFVSTIEPLHKRDGVTEIDATWTPDTGAWQWKLAATDFGVNARSVLNAGDIVQWTHTASGENVILQPLALNWVNNVTDSRQQITQPQAVTATANDCSLTWQNGYGTGRHFRYTAHPRRLVKEFIVDAASYLPTPTVSNPYLEVEFILKASAGLKLHVDGTAWDRSTKRNTANRIEFRVTATGASTFYFEAPSAHDSSTPAKTIPGIMQLRRQGANRYVTVRFPKAWIDTAVFPIVLDPTLQDGAGGDVNTNKDTMLYEGSADGNYGARTSFDCGDDYSKIRSLMQFDVSSLDAGVTINSATLTLACAWAQASTSYNCTIHRSLVAWYEGTLTGGTPGAGQDASTWNHRNHNGDVHWGAVGGASGTDYTASATATTAVTGVNLYTWDGKTDVAAWVAGTATNYGWWLLGNEAVTDSDKSFCSSDYATTEYRPKLVVDYTAGGTTYQPRYGFVYHGDPGVC